MKYMQPFCVTFVVVVVTSTSFSLCTDFFNSNNPMSMYLYIGILRLSPQVPRYPFLRSHSKSLFCPMLIPFCARTFASSPTRHDP